MVGAISKNYRKSQRTANSEQGTGNREQGTANSEQRTLTEKKYKIPPDIHTTITLFETIGGGKSKHNFQEIFQEKK